MADTKTTDLSPATSVNTDIIEFVDVSDTTDDPAGSSRRETKADFLSGKADTSHTHTKSEINDFSDGDYATAAQGTKADTAVQSVVAGSNITVDNTDPQNPVVSASGSGSGSGSVEFVSNVAQDRILGRTSTGSGNSEQLTAAQVRAFLNIEDGATADQTGAEIEAALDAELGNTDWKSSSGSGAGSEARIEDGLLIVSTTDANQTREFEQQSAYLNRFQPQIPLIGEIGISSDDAVSQADNGAPNREALLNKKLEAYLHTGCTITLWAAGEFWGNYNLEVYDWDGSALTARAAGRVLETLLPKWSDRLGVNVAGLEFGGSSLEASAAYWNALGAKGIKVCRIPFLWERVQPTLGGALDSTELGKLKTQVARAQAAGFTRIILDMHNYAAHGSDVIGAGTATQAHYNDAWERLNNEAELATSDIEYDLMNEPHQITRTEQETSSQAVVTHLRNAGCTNILYAATRGFSGVQDALDHPNWWITDPLNRTRITSHDYLDRNNSGQDSTSYAQDVTASANDGNNDSEDFKFPLIVNDASEQLIVERNGKLYAGGTTENAQDKKFTVVGDGFAVRDADTPTKGFRTRFGDATDFEFSGVDAFFSYWDGPYFTGTQHNIFKFNANELEFQKRFTLSDNQIKRLSYLGFNDTYGASGIGLRVNAGVMEYKDDSGSWTAFNSLGSGVLTQTEQADGFTISGGSTTARTLTVTGGNVTLEGGSANKGDIFVADGAGNFERLPIGANGQVLEARSTEALGVRWIANSGGSGSVTSGAGAPTAAPTSTEAIYHDLTNKRVYHAFGTTSVSDWRYTETSA